MISTRDEIMFKFASMQDDDPDIVGELPIAVPPGIEDLEEISPEDVHLIEKPIEEKPSLSKRVPFFKDPFEDRGLIPGKYQGTDWPWEDPRPGSVEWAAQNYTKEYLRGVDMPYRGYARDPQNDKITKATMDRLIAVDPEKYFEWGLRRREELKPWMVPAAAALIDKDPYKALLMGIFKQGEEVKHLLPKLWQDIIGLEFQRSSESESGQIFPGVIFNRMRSLAGEIARTNPQFYIDSIAETGIGQKFRTKQFDSWAANAIRDR